MKITLFSTTLPLLFTLTTAFPVFENGKVLDSRDLEARFPPQANQRYPGANFTKTPLSIFYLVLNTQPDPDWDLLNQIVSFDCTYVSLTYDNPNLHQIMPWAGTHYHTGPQAIVDVFTQVGETWNRGPFTIDFMFGQGGNVTAWGMFTAQARTTGTTVISPWAARAQVDEETMMITDLQWMEDTFTTASSFWDNTTKKRYLAYPGGGSVEM